MIDTIRKEYENDKFFKIILEKPEENQQLFHIHEEMIHTTNTQGDEVTCIPVNRKIITEIITSAHTIVGHFSELKTSKYIRKWYWWPSMAKDIKEFCRTCNTCQTTKAVNKKMIGKLHPLPIPVRPWESIGMDFIGPFPELQGKNYLWVIICRMTSMVHLIPINTTDTAEKLSWIYIKEVV